VCGTGAGAFDIFDQGTHNQHAIRFPQRGWRPDPACHLRSILPVQQSAHRRGGSLHALAGRAQTAAVLGDLPTSSRAAVSRMADFFNKPVEQTP
jgi:hypothetical protein